MGLLDDAIREHLSLQRRNGASDQEIAVKEAEALGPARRGELEQTAQATTGAATAEREPLEEKPSASEDAAPEDDHVEEPVAKSDEVVEEDDHHDLDLANERLDIDMPASQAEPPVDAEPVASASDDEPPASSSDDVLEETPDFLHETPEHERLWFEQKPPRDFDFDD